MRYWYQNLNDHGQKLFHFRGSVSSDRRALFHYEVASGPELRLKYTHGEACDSDASSRLTFGLLFFTVYLTFYLPRSWYFQKKCIATWDGNKEFYLVDGRDYGFYVYQWAIVWRWHERVHESRSNTPWYRSFYFHIDNFFFGEPEVLERDLVGIENIKFKIGGKEFVMNSIQWKQRQRFRRHIPFSIYHRDWVAVEMKIDRPPMRAGKGENSWDLDDDGSFGLYMAWPHEKPTYLNRKEMAKLAIEEYVANALKDAKRYGSGSGDHGIRASDMFEYIGQESSPKEVLI